MRREYIMRRSPIAGQHKTAFKYSGDGWGWSLSVKGPGFATFEEAMKRNGNRQDEIVAVENGQVVRTCQGCGMTDSKGPEGSCVGVVWLEGGPDYCNFCILDASPPMTEGKAILTEPLRIQTGNPFRDAMANNHGIHTNS
jgi:hypothetical protein